MLEVLGERVLMQLLLHQKRQNLINNKYGVSDGAKSKKEKFNQDKGAERGMLLIREAPK